MEPGGGRVSRREIVVPTSEEYERGELGERRELEGSPAEASVPAVELPVRRLRLEVPDEVAQRPMAPQTRRRPL